MSWLIGIVCVILVIAFWRFFLPLAGVLALVAGLFIWYHHNEDEKKKKEKIAAAEEIRNKVAAAQKNQTAEGKEWTVFYRKDPASEQEIARKAFITSNDGLCSMSVEKRLSGAEFTDLSCHGMEIDSYEDIEVKFDTGSISHKMELQRYSGGGGVYVPSYQYKRLGYLSYEEFIKNLTTANAIAIAIAIAIKVPAEHVFWTKFTLKGAPQMIGALGKPKPVNVDTVAQ